MSNPNTPRTNAAEITRTENRLEPDAVVDSKVCEQIELDLNAMTAAAKDLALALEILAREAKDAGWHKSTYSEAQNALIRFNNI